MSISENIRDVSHQISLFEEKYGRKHGSVTLLAVSKTHSSDKIIKAHDTGQLDFAENYYQEAEEKIIILKNYPLNWHFIGPIQSNKTKGIAENFSWVHSVDRLKIAHRLHSHRPPLLPPLKVLLQVNIDGDKNKSGCTPSQLHALASEIKNLSRLSLVGLMTIPSVKHSVEKQRLVFKQLYLLRMELEQQGFKDCLHLSMGMSQDYEAAIAEGATMIRIGTGIFGKRETLVK